MVQTHIQEQIRANPKWAALVEQAAKLLEAQVGISTTAATADWSIAQANGDRPLIGVKVSDPLATVEARFTLDELANHDYMERRMIRLWGDLLQIRSHKLLAKLRETVQALEGD